MGIAVSGNGSTILDNDASPSTSDNTDFGGATLGGAVPQRAFTVRNDGSSNLTTSGLSVPAGFSVVEGLSASIGPGGFDTFTVQLSTGSVGPSSGQIAFATNDSNKNPFNFSTTGMVAPPVHSWIITSSSQTVREGGLATVRFERSRAENTETVYYSTTMTHGL